MTFVKAEIVDFDGGSIKTTNPLPVTITSGTITAPIVGGNTAPVKTQESPTIADPIAHRTNVATADKITSPTCVDKLAAGAADITLATTALYGAIAARIYGMGSAGAGTISAAFTPTLNKSVLMTVAQVASATHYDLFLSVDAAPKWVARITEAQRAAGCAVTAVGVVGTGGSAGVVDIRVVGTGVQTTASEFANNNAYNIAGITPVPCAGWNKAQVDLIFVRGDCLATPSCSVIPLTKTTIEGVVTWAAGDAYTMNLGTTVGAPMTKGVDFEVGGKEALVVVCNPVGGTFSANVTRR